MGGRCTRALLAVVLLAGLGVPALHPPGAEAEQVFNLTGSGFGHGLGMSQYGALGQAMQGRTYSDILSHYYQGATLASVALPNPIRVGILQEQGSLNFTGSGPTYQIRVGSMVWAASSGTWNITAIPGGLRVRDPGGGTADVASSTAQISGFEESGAQISVSQNGRTYGRGAVELVKASDTTFHVVVVLDYEKYLYGLGEMPSSWPSHALRAQAVAARTYALYKHNTSGDRRPGCECTVFASTYDQVYVGWSKEAGPYGDAWRAAVDGTASQVLTYGGSPILAAYHSSSGGHTEANEDVWGGSPLPYLRPVPDPWSQIPENPSRSWNASFSASQLASVFGLESVSGIDLSRRTQGGGLAWAVIHGVKGGVPVSEWVKGTTFRSKLGLRSTKIHTNAEPGFDEWILLLNPDTSSVRANLSVQRAGLPPADFAYDLPPRSRSSIRVNDLVPPGEVSVKVTADRPIAAERAMYFGYRSWLGGHSAEGLTEARKAWYLAEGYETDKFDTYVLVFNPEPVSTTVRLTLMRDDGYVQTVEASIGPNWRYTLAASSVPGFANAAFSTKVEADSPVVVERATYFDYRSPVTGGASDGGASSPAMTGTSTRWHFAEGYSGPDFDTWVLLQNPNDSRATARVTFYVEGSTPRQATLEVAPRSRATLLASSVPGVSGHSHSISVESDLPIAAERAEYFGYQGIAGGSTAQPIPEPQTKWYLTEGYSGPGFDTWILLSNPLTETVGVRATFMVQDGSPVTKDFSLPPTSRTTLNLGSIVGPVSAATVLESRNGRPFGAERASYFHYSSPAGWKSEGGSASMGATRLSTEWYFAEGYLK